MTMPPAPQPPVPPSQSPGPGPQSNKGLFIVLGVVGGILVLGCLCCSGLFLGGRLMWTSRSSTKTTILAPAVESSPLSVSVASALPSDIPLYPGATAAGGAAHMPPGIPMSGGVWHTSDKPSNVADFYHEKLVANGWTETNTKSTASSTTSIFQKGGRTATVNANLSAAGTMIIITCTEPSPAPTSW